MGILKLTFHWIYDSKTNPIKKQYRKMNLCKKEDGVSIEVFPQKKLIQKKN